VLLQLPPDLRADPDLLRDCLRQFPARLRVAVQPRHESWWTDEVRGVRGGQRRAVLGGPGRFRPGSLWRTADWGYLRFHEGDGDPWPRGGKATRAWPGWAAGVSQGRRAAGAVWTEERRRSDGGRHGAPRAGRARRRLD